jgi:hypothetical protein
MPTGEEAVVHEGDRKQYVLFGGLDRHTRPVDARIELQVDNMVCVNGTSPYSTKALMQSLGALPDMVNGCYEPCF